MRARTLGAGKEIRVASFGERRSILFDPVAPGDGQVAGAFDRQVRAFGARAQRVLQGLHVAIVGLGGTGSIVCQQLAHLGVGEFTLIESDTVEITNLNRLAGASNGDFGRPKVDIAAEGIQRVAPNARVHVFRADVTRAPTARTLTGVDLIFGCTDSHGSRAVLQQVAYQYLIPLVDMGVVIVARAPEITHAYGRVQLLAPGKPCFTCSGLLNPEQVRRDMLSEVERKADPYIVGQAEPAPAVMSINGTVASLSVTMALAVMADVPSKGRHLLYGAGEQTPAASAGSPTRTATSARKKGPWRVRSLGRSLLGRQRRDHSGDTHACPQAGRVVQKHSARGGGRCLHAPRLQGPSFNIVRQASLSGGHVWRWRSGVHTIAG